MSGLPPAAILDVDGTLTKRRFGGESRDIYKPEIWDPKARTPYDWHRVGEDPPNLPMIQVARRLRRAGLMLLVVSGRSEVCYVNTSQWLLSHGVIYHELFMAPASASENGIPDREVKAEIYLNAIRPRFDVEIVFDDRNEVVNYWRSAGLLCGQVGPGAF